tara:strand:+ start:338 stop:724 length:387 start_codon:yes stop_codon:yes gene_type:complete
MGRSAKRKQQKTVGRFLILRHDIMDSDAWLSLSPKARCIWTLIAKRHNGLNNGDIPLSVREAAKHIRSGKSTASRGFDELIDRRFIKVSQDAGLTMKYGRRARRFTLTHEGVNNQIATNDWKTWQPQK